MPILPPALAVGAQYDSLLQSALTQFFERASLETQPEPSPSSDGRLSIDPTADPSALSIRWFGTRYTLRVPGRPPLHRPRGALRPGHRRGAVGPLPGHPQPAA